MSRVVQVCVQQPWISRPARYRPDYETAASCALAFMRPLREGFITYSELEGRIVPYLAGPAYERANAATDEAAGFIQAALNAAEAARGVR